MTLPFVRNILASPKQVSIVNYDKVFLIFNISDEPNKISKKI